MVNIIINYKNIDFHHFIMINLKSPIHSYNLLKTMVYQNRRLVDLKK